MPECSYDPIRRRYHGWKKWLVGPIERACLRRAKALVATCPAEADWIRSYLGNRCPPIIVTDIKRFFNLPSVPCSPIPVARPLHLLYLGRRHPLKGLSHLESALATYYNMLSETPTSNSSAADSNTTYYNKCPIEFRAVSNASGEGLEKVWGWCDVLVLPTLSDNFGLVIAEALERGKRVITTDGAPAWGDGNDYGGRLIYLKGFRYGSPEDRVRLLKNAIVGLICQSY